MEILNELKDIDYLVLIVWVIAVLLAVKFIYELIEWFIKLLGLETKSMRQRREEHELLVKTANNLDALQKRHEEDVRQSIRHDELIKNDIKMLSDNINNIADTLNDMKEKDNITELKRLKDTLVGYYNKYKNSDGWTKVEKDVFWDLFEDYELRGGDGYVHSIVEPVMRELKELD